MADCEKILIWQSTESDLEGCVCLHRAEPLKYQGSLTAASAPTLAVLAKLREDGFVAQSKIINHRPRAGKFYDTRGLFLSRKIYMQCVLSQRALFEKKKQQQL